MLPLRNNQRIELAMHFSADLRPSEKSARAVLRSIPGADEMVPQTYSYSPFDEYATASKEAAVVLADKEFA